MDVVCRSHTTATAALRLFVNATRRPRKQTLPNLIIVEEINVCGGGGGCKKTHVSFLECMNLSV
jgi:hypothetical protein